MHDAPVACTRAFLSDFRVCDTVIPAFIGCIGKLSLSRTDRYPKQTPGKWVELDPTAGFEWGRCAGLEDIGLCTRWFRWNYPAAGMRPSDAAILDATWKTFMNPSASLLYRFNGPTRGRVEFMLSVRESFSVWNDLKAFGMLNTWFIDYSRENSGKESGASAGELALGLSWRWLYFKTTYWFPLDRRVLSGEKPTYDYDKKLILSAGFRFEF